VTTWFEICETRCAISAIVPERRFNAEEFIKPAIQERFSAEMTVERTIQLMLDNVLSVESNSENDKCKSYCKGD
jgi:hypothetical protein